MITSRGVSLSEPSLDISADDDDALYRNNVDSVSAAAPSWLNVKLLFYPRVPNRVPSREAAQQAYVDGAEYLHRTNDDILYLIPGWITRCAATRRTRARLAPF